MVVANTKLPRLRPLFLMALAMICLGSGGESTQSDSNLLVVVLNEETDRLHGRFYEVSKHFGLLSQLQDRLNKVTLRSVGYDIHLFASQGAIDPALRQQLLVLAAKSSSPVYFPYLGADDQKQLLEKLEALGSPSLVSSGRCLLKVVGPESTGGAGSQVTLIQEAHYSGDVLQQNLVTRMLWGDRAVEVSQSVEVRLKPTEEGAHTKISVQELLALSPEAFEQRVRDQHILVGVDYPGIDEFETPAGAKVNGVFILAQLFESLKGFGSPTAVQPDPSLNIHSKTR